MAVLPIDEVFRDHVIDGVPSSGAHKPSKVDIRDTLDVGLHTLADGTEPYNEPTKVLNRLRLTEFLKDDGFLSINHFSSIANALANAVPAKLSPIDYFITEPLNIQPFGGLLADGEKTRLIRAFSGGPMVNYDGGQPIILEDMQITTNTGQAVVAGDIGVKIGFISAWAQRGRIRNLLIMGQYDGFAWKAGTDGPISNVTCLANVQHGFHGTNPRGLFYGCNSQLNGSEGYQIDYADPGETGVDFVVCRTFANQGWGWKTGHAVGALVANLNMIGTVASFDGAGGIAIISPMTQFRLHGHLGELAGNSSDWEPAFVDIDTAPGLYLDHASINRADIQHTKFIHNKGMGLHAAAAAHVQMMGLLISGNGKGLAAGHRTGLALNGSVKVLGGNIDFEIDTDSSQTYDIAINSATVSGHLSRIGTSGQIYSTEGNTLRMDGVSGPAADVQTIASAATITLPPYGDFFKLSGASAISTINGGWAGRRATFLNSGTASMTEGGQLALVGNWSPTAFDTIRLVYDGSNWFEDGGRSGDI